MLKVSDITTSGSKPCLPTRSSRAGQAPNAKRAKRSKVSDFLERRLHQGEGSSPDTRSQFTVNRPGFESLYQRDEWSKEAWAWGERPEWETCLHDFHWYFGPNSNPAKKCLTDVLPIWSVGLAASLGKRLPKQHVQREGNTCVMMIIIITIIIATIFIVTLNAIQQLPAQDTRKRRPASRTQKVCTNVSNQNKDIFENTIKKVFKDPTDACCHLFVWWIPWDMKHHTRPWLLSSNVFFGEFGDS